MLGACLPVRVALEGPAPKPLHPGHILRQPEVHPYPRKRREALVDVERVEDLSRTRFATKPRSAMTCHRMTRQGETAGDATLTAHRDLSVARKRALQLHCDGRRILPDESKRREAPGCRQARPGAPGRPLSSERRLALRRRRLALSDTATTLETARPLQLLCTYAGGGCIRAATRSSFSPDVRHASA